MAISSISLLPIFCIFRSNDFFQVLASLLFFVWSPLPGTRPLIHPCRSTYTKCRGSMWASQSDSLTIPSFFWYDDTGHIKGPFCVMPPILLLVWHRRFRFFWWKVGVMPKKDGHGHARQSFFCYDHDSGHKGPFHLTLPICISYCNNLHI